MDIGQRIRAARKRAGLSQEEVARRAGMSLKGMAYIERGHIEDPHYSSLAGIAEALGVSVGELLEEPVPFDAASEAGQGDTAANLIEERRPARLAPLIARLEAQNWELGELRDRQREIEERLRELKPLVPFRRGVKEEITNEPEYYDLADELFAIQTVLEWNNDRQPFAGE